MILRALKLRGFALTLGTGGYLQTYRVNSVGSEIFVPDDLATQHRDRIDAGESAGLFTIVEDTADSRIDATGGALELLDGSSGNVVIDDGAAFEFANGSTISGDSGAAFDITAGGADLELHPGSGGQVETYRGSDNTLAWYTAPNGNWLANGNKSVNANAGTVTAGNITGSGGAVLDLSGVNEVQVAGNLLPDADSTRSFGSAAKNGL